MLPTTATPEFIPDGAFLLVDDAQHDLAGIGHRCAQLPVGIAQGRLVFEVFGQRLALIHPVYTGVADAIGRFQGKLHFTATTGFGEERICRDLNAVQHSAIDGVPLQRDAALDLTLQRALARPGARATRAAWRSCRSCRR